MKIKLQVTNQRTITVKAIPVTTTVNRYCVVLNMASDCDCWIRVPKDWIDKDRKLVMSDADPLYEVTSSSFRQSVDAEPEYGYATSKPEAAADPQDFSTPWSFETLSNTYRTERVMPAMEDIPQEFKRDNNPWVVFQRTWFFSGLTDDNAPKVKQGLKFTDVWRHLSVIQRSFDTRHEHKQAAVAYLASKWLEPSPHFSK